jgi:squalene-hopene/tetraprenyl-beta-curcumene cyclase
MTATQGRMLARIDAAVLGDRHARLINSLTARVDPQGAVRERCASRVAESALFLRLLQGEHAEPGVQDGLISYLRGAEPGDEGSQIIRDAVLGHPDLRRAGAFCERFEHGTGERKQLMLRTAFALFDLLPFDDLPPIRYRGQAVWTEVSLCACKILHGHAHGRRDEADQAFLTSHLASAGPARVWQGNILAHLIALHALRTFEPGGLLTTNGIEAVAATRHGDGDGGVPFVTSQDVFDTALAGIGLAAGDGPPQLIARMADWVAAQQLPDGGWGYSTDTSQTDTDDAARCIQFLHLVNPERYRQAVENGYAYLAGMADQDGGFPTYVQGHPPEVDVTAAAIIALGSDPDRHADLIGSSVRYLTGQSQDHGSYPRGWTMSESSVIRLVLDALAGVPDPDPAVRRAMRNSIHRLCQDQNGDGGWGQTWGDPSDALSTAQALAAIIGRAPGPLTDRAVRWLLDQQHDDGGFTSIPDQVGPRPLPYDFPVLASIHALNALNAARENAPAQRSGQANAPALTTATSASPQSGGTGETGGTGRLLPAFFCPFPSAVHPLAEQADARSVEFMYRYGLCAGDAERARLAQAGCGEMVARACPTAPADLLQVTSDYNLWAFAFDDEYCDEGQLQDRPGELADAVARIQRCVDVPEHTVYPGDRYGASLREIRSRFARCSTPLEADRFADTMRGYFAAEVRKAGFVARGQRPGLDDYTLYRLYGGGTMVFTELIAVCNGCPAPPRLLADRRVRAIIEVAATLTVWGTDVFSFGKETERTGDGFNLIDAICQETGCEADEAYERAMIMWDRMMTLFLRLRGRLTAELPQLAGYVNGLGQYIRGVLDWCQTTKRYVYLDGLRGTRAYTPGGWRATPRDSSTDPLPIPSVSWWWRYDPATTASPAQQLLLTGHPTGLGTSAVHSLLRDREQSH